MLPLLLTVSFLINIIILIGMYSLYKEINILKNNTSNINITDIAELFDFYLEEIKAENSRLENKNVKNEPLSHIKSSPYQSKTVIPDLQMKNISIDQISAKDDAKTTLESKVLQLSSKGYSSDHIAEKLNCGKVEAALIIKLYSKNHKC